MAAEGSRGFFRLNALDRRGRKIEPAVLEAAEGIYSRALEHGLKLLGDPAVVQLHWKKSRPRLAGDKDQRSA
jgi:hypothetical protein